MRAIICAARWLLASVLSAVGSAVVYGLTLTTLGVAYELISQQGSSGAGLVGYFAIVLAIPVYFLGIAALGPPTQAILTKIGFDGAKAAALAGGLLSSLGAWAMFGTLALAHSPLTFALLAIPAPIAGAIGGLGYRATMLHAVKPRRARPS